MPPPWGIVSIVSQALKGRNMDFDICFALFYAMGARLLEDYIAE